MAATQVFSFTNLVLAATPPVLFAPNSVGVAVPANKTGYDLAIDLGAPVPAGQSLAIGVEYQRNAWTDASGIVHPAGEWLPDVSATMTTGSYTTRLGVKTTVNHLTSSIGATSQGGMVEPYPTHARVRVDQSGSWTIPSVTLTLS